MGGGLVADLSVEINIKGLLQLKWSLPNNVEDVQKYEIEYSAVLPLDVKQADVNTFGCSGSYSIELLCDCHFPRIYSVESNPI